MNKSDDNKIKALIHSIGLKYNLSDHIIKKIVESPYEFTALTLKELDLNEVKTKDELDNIKTNFLYKSFAKIYANFLLINRRNKQKENINKINLNQWKK
jgi:hypothetical protein|tara:strand:+ start:6856 stop:7152 length:297 start_codon:yes stop_codon:yes gene_type:complete